MINDQYLLTLPSDSSRLFYPENEPNRFRIHLPKSLDLEGDWEVALVDILYPHNWSNFEGEYVAFAALLKQPVDDSMLERSVVAEDTHQIIGQPNEECGPLYRSFTNYVKDARIEDVNFSHIFKMPTAYFQNSGEFGDYFTKRLNQLLPAGYQILNNYDQKMQTNNFSGQNIVEFQIFSSSEKLSNWLGLPYVQQEETLYVSNLLSHEPTKCHFENLTTMYIYCDMIKYQILGDMEVPLLATFPIQGTHGEQSYWAYNTSCYIPIDCKTLSTIDISICTQDGTLFPFHPSGKVILHLHLRRQR